MTISLGRYFVTNISQTLNKICAFERRIVEKEFFRILCWESPVLAK